MRTSTSGLGKPNADKSGQGEKGRKQVFFGASLCIIGNQCRPISVLKDAVSALNFNQRNIEKDGVRGQLYPDQKA